MSKYVIEREWLREKYEVECLPVEDIAALIGCSVANVRKRVKDYDLSRDCGSVIRAGHKEPWNKRLDKSNSEVYAKMSRDRLGEGNPMYGRTSWNKGLTAEEDERLASVSAKMKTRVLSEETREKMRQAKSGLRGADTNRWVGEDMKTKNGYMIRTVDGCQVYVHRDVAEKCIGRSLLNNEHVHHYDGDKSNNDPLNLLVLINGDHTNLHRFVRSKQKSDQIKWLKDNGIWFLEVKSENQVS